jgi:hypothetical protein
MSQSINELWESRDEEAWRRALASYWEISSVRRHLNLKEFIETLDSGAIRNAMRCLLYRTLHNTIQPTSSCTLMPPTTLSRDLPFGEMVKAAWEGGLRPCHRCGREFVALEHTALKSE